MSTVLTVRSSVREQAIAWFARSRAQDFDAQQARQLAMWRAADPDHDSAWAEIERQWSGAQRLADASEIAKLREEIVATSSHTQPTGQRSPRWLPTALAAALATVAVVIGLQFSPQDVDTVANFATQVGEHRTIQLEDRSEIILDTASAVRVVYSGRERRVDLLQGRAHFAVEKNPDRPFVVQAGGGSITALGTQFNVAMQGDVVTVYLAQGKVRVGGGAGTGAAEKVADDSFTAILAPGEQLAFRGADIVIPQRRVSADVASGWLERNLVLRETSLLDAVNELNRYSVTRILIEDEQLQDAKLNGVFHLDDRTGFLQAVQAALSVQAVPQPNGDVRLVRTVGRE